MYGRRLLAPRPAPPVRRGESQTFRTGEVLGTHGVGTSTRTPSVGPDTPLPGVLPGTHLTLRAQVDPQTRVVESVCVSGVFPGRPARSRALGEDGPPSPSLPRRGPVQTEKGSCSRVTAPRTRVCPRKYVPLVSPRVSRGGRARSWSGGGVDPFWGQVGFVRQGRLP